MLEDKVCCRRLTKGNKLLVLSASPWGKLASPGRSRLYSKSDLPSNCICGGFYCKVFQLVLLLVFNLPLEVTSGQLSTKHMCGSLLCAVMWHGDRTHQISRADTNRSFQMPLPFQCSRPLWGQHLLIGERLRKANQMWKLKLTSAKAPTKSITCWQINLVFIGEWVGGFEDNKMRKWFLTLS